MIIVSSGKIGYIYDWCFVKRLRWRTGGKKSSQYIYSTGTQGQISACAVDESVQSGKFWGEARRVFRSTLTYS